jgi:DNA-binding NtrC family response regulator
MDEFKALIVDDEKTYAAALARALRRRGVECEIALDAETALAKARSTGPYQVVLLDNRLPDDLGLRIITRLRAIMPGTGIVMMTAYESIEDAVEAMRLGAEDYAAKSTHTEPLVARVLEVRERMLARAGYDPDVPVGAEEALMGTSDAVRSVRDRLDEVASSPLTPVLLVGETGTGKGAAARYIHRKGSDPASAFVTLPCSTGPAGPADSALFGRIRHTVSGGEVIEEGVLDAAGEGVLFLDGIDEAPDRLQRMLLGVFGSRRFRRVGSSDEVTFRARIVAGASRMPEQGVLHERLVQQLDVFPVRLPALRERREDIVPLADVFIDHFARRMGKTVSHVSDDVAAMLSSYDFPGNVRELRNIVERAVIIVRGGSVYPEHLPERVRQGSSGAREEDEDAPPDGDDAAGGGLGVEFVPGVDTIDSVEKRLIVQALSMSGGVKSRAAKLLGISRFQLLRRLEKYGLDAKKQ